MTATMGQEAQEVLALWEAAEDEATADNKPIDYRNVFQIFEETAGGYHANLFLASKDSPTWDDNVFLRIYNDHRQFIFHIHTGDDPIYTQLATTALITSAELPASQGR